MAGPSDKTGRQQLEEERVATLACLVIYEATLVSANQASKRISEE